MPIVFHPQRRAPAGDSWIAVLRGGDSTEPVEDRQSER
jgi:hypothetical protein